MSLKETGELIKSILNNVKISWIGMAIIILLLMYCSSDSLCACICILLFG